jgi:hypothetical protein
VRHSAAELSRIVADGWQDRGSLLSRIVADGWQDRGSLETRGLI